MGDLPDVCEVGLGSMEVNQGPETGTLQSVEAVEGRSASCGHTPLDPFVAGQMGRGGRRRNR
jgi:hypothetical protein